MGSCTVLRPAAIGGLITGAATKDVAARRGRLLAGLECVGQLTARAAIWRSRAQRRTTALTEATLAARTAERPLADRFSDTARKSISW